MKKEIMGWQCINWTICKSSASCSRQTTTSASHRSNF